MRLQGMKMVSASSISDPIIQLIASLALAFVCMPPASRA
jgi:subfamily B ATP-binding cassette protein MsbA